MSIVYTSTCLDAQRQEKREKFFFQAYHNEILVQFLQYNIFNVKEVNFSIRNI